jgi:predicted metal-binding protein
VTGAFVTDALLSASETTGVPVHEKAILPVTALVFSPALLDSCKTNVCGNYNKSWVCPPACESIEEQKKKILFYKNLLVFTTVHTLEDSFDYDGMTKGRELHSLLTSELKKILKDTPVYGAGNCPVCKPCAFPVPCPFPEKKINSIEAAGIDVTALSKAAGIAYNNGECTVTFFSMALF